MITGDFRRIPYRIVLNHIGKSDDAMKRFFTMVLAIAAILCLAAASGAAETGNPDFAAFDAFHDSNATREVLARNGNVRMTRKTFFGEEVTRTEICYRADGLFLWSYGDGNYMLRTPDCFVERYPEEEYEYIYGTTIFDSAEDRAAFFESVQAEDFLSMLEEETLEKTYITDDGLFIAETRCSNPVIVRTHLGETEYTGSYVYADGMVMDFRYAFDMETSDLMKLDSFITDAEGKTCIYQSETYEYGIEPYDPAADSELFADYFARVSVPENLRTIRIVYDPDTDNEKNAEALLPVNTWFGVFHNGAYTQNLFTDRECTRRCDDFAVEDDLELYALSE